MRVVTKVLLALASLSLSCGAFIKIWPKWPWAFWTASLFHGMT